MKAYSLVGIDGNAYSIMGYTVKAMQAACKQVRSSTVLQNFGNVAQTAYRAEATSSDYNHLICVSVDMLDRVNKSFEEEGFKLELL